LNNQLGGLAAKWPIDIIYLNIYSCIGIFEGGSCMSKEFILGNEVRAIDVDNTRTISQILEKMEQTGFQGRNFAKSVSVMEKMILNPDVTIMFGYSGSLSTTGQWKIIQWLIDNNFIDVLVPTGANISEDIVEAMGCSYFQGTRLADDERLFREGYNRYYDVYGSEEEYMRMTEMIAEFIIECLCEENKYSSMEFLFLFGLWLKSKGIENIVSTAASRRIPIFCPAIVDSPYGDAGLIAESNGFHLTLDNMKDYSSFMHLGEKVKDTGVIYIGGGVPKDFIQLFAVTANLLYKNRQIPNRKGRIRDKTSETYYPHKYAVQVTMAIEADGGLSSCAPDSEAVSWGKEVTSGGMAVQCFCESTIALPIMIHALSERLDGFVRQSKNFGLFDNLIQEHSQG
jgi:deoxyhypusine synthase